MLLATNVFILVHDENTVFIINNELINQVAPVLVCSFISVRICIHSFFVSNGIGIYCLLLSYILMVNVSKVTEKLDLDAHPVRKSNDSKISGVYFFMFCD